MYIVHITYDSRSLYISPTTNHLSVVQSYLQEFIVHCVIQSRRDAELMRDKQKKAADKAKGGT